MAKSQPNAPDPNPKFTPTPEWVRWAALAAAVALLLAAVAWVVYMAPADAANDTLDPGNFDLVQQLNMEIAGVPGGGVPGGGVPGGGVPVPGGGVPGG